MNIFFLKLQTCTDKWNNPGCCGEVLKLVLLNQLQFDLVWFYGISTSVGYLMPNPLYTHIYIYIYILNIYDLVWFYGISSIVGYLMPNPLYTYIYIKYIWFGLVLWYTIVGYLMPNPIFTYI